MRDENHPSVLIRWETSTAALVLWPMLGTAKLMQSIVQEV